MGVYWVAFPAWYCYIFLLSFNENVGPDRGEDRSSGSALKKVFSVPPNSTAVQPTLDHLTHKFT